MSHYVNEPEEILGLLQRDYRELFSLVALDELNAGQLPEDERRGRFLELLDSILHGTRNLERTLASAAALAGKVHATLEPVMAEFYKDTVRKHWPLISQLYIEHHPDGVFEELLAEAEKLPDPGKPTPWVENTIHAALSFYDDAMEEDDWRREEKFSFDGAWELLDAAYYQPDSWLRNGRELRPVLTAGFNVYLPAPLRHRLGEVYLSFTFGNWMAVMALTRSILEYAILDNSRRLGISTRHTSNPRWTKELGELVEELVMRRPDLEDSMRYLVDKGNFIMHPEHGKDVPHYPARKIMARKCIEHIRNVVGELYSG
jgi:hypothetical protein